MHPRDLQRCHRAAGPLGQRPQSETTEDAGREAVRRGAAAGACLDGRGLLISIGTCLNLFDYLFDGACPVGSFQRCSAAGPVRPKVTGAPGSPLADVTA